MDVKRFVHWSWAAICLLAAATLYADPAQDQFSVGAGHYGQRRWNLAVEEFRGFLAEFPRHPQAAEARFFIGESLVQQRDFAAAAREYDALVEQQPPEPWARKALFRAGETHLFAGDSAEAIKRLDQFIARYPQDALTAYALPYRGDLAREAGESAVAEKSYRRAIEQFPDGPLADEARFGLAQALEKQSQTAEAIELLRAVANRPRGEWADDALLRLARLRYDGKEFRPAAAACDELRANFPNSPLLPRAELLRGQALFGLEQWSAAREAFASLSKHDAVGAEAQMWLGLAECAAGEWSAAAATLLAASQREDAGPLAPRMLCHAAEAQLLAGRVQESRELFDRAARDAEDAALKTDALLGSMRASLMLADHAAIERGWKDVESQDPHSAAFLLARRLHWRSLLDQGRAAEVLAALQNDAKAQLAEDRYILALAYDALARPADVRRAVEPLLASAEPEIRAGALALDSAALIALGQHADAIGPLKTLISMTGTPNDMAKARAQLAVCLARVDRVDEARQVFRELASSEAPAEIVAPCAAALAETARAGQDATWARELYQHLARDQSTPELAAQGRLGLAALALDDGQLDQAAAELDHLLASEPPGAVATDAAHSRAAILERQQDWKQALQVYERLIAESPAGETRMHALAGAARVHSRLAQPAAAQKLYEQLLSEFPESPARDAWLYEAAWSARAQGNTAAAAPWFDELRTKHGESRYWADAVYRLAEQSLAAGQVDVAEKRLEELLSKPVDPGVRSYARYLQAQCFVARGAWSQVALPLERLLSEQPETSLAPLARYWIAEAAYRLGDFEAANERFVMLEKKLTKPEPWQAMIPLRRAQSLLQLKEYRKAEQVAAGIAQQFPDFAQQHEVDYVLGRAAAAQARFDDAREAYRRVVRSAQGEKTETAAMAQWMIGETFFHQKNFEAALREYLRVEILYDQPTWQAGGLLQAGKCHEALGEWAQAVELYSRALTNYGENSFTEEASRRLQAARQRLASRP